MKILIASITLSFLVFAPKLRADQHAESKTNNGNDPIEVAALTSSPVSYQGKLVFVRGYVTIQLENDTICPTKIKKVADLKKCLWLEIDQGPYNTKSDMDRYRTKKKVWLQFNNRVVAIRGLFDSSDTDRTWSGSIKNISDIYDSDRHVKFP